MGRSLRPICQEIGTEAAYRSEECRFDAQDLLKSCLHLETIVPLSSSHDLRSKLRSMYHGELIFKLLLWNGSNVCVAPGVGPGLELSQSTSTKVKLAMA